MPFNGSRVVRTAILSLLAASIVAASTGCLGKSKGAPSTLYPIETADQGFEGFEIAFYVAIPDSLSLEDKLELIADRLSRFVFNYAPLEVMKLDSLQGRLIAHVNLAADSLGRPWTNEFFQGSAGGGMTSHTLRTAFLQYEHEGDWVDGVRFYLNGEPLRDGVWDHIVLHGIFYRDRTHSVPPEAGG